MLRVAKISIISAFILFSFTIATSVFAQDDFISPTDGVKQVDQEGGKFPLKDIADTLPGGSLTAVVLIPLVVMAIVAYVSKNVMVTSAVFSIVFAFMVFLIDAANIYLWLFVILFAGSTVFIGLKTGLSKN